MVKKIYTGKLKIPENVQVELDGNSVRVNGSKGELQHIFSNPRIVIAREGDVLIIRCRDDIKFSRRDKVFINTYIAQLKNAFHGVTNGYTAKLKICSGHFPMNVSISGNVLFIKNFLGEKVPRKTSFVEGVKVDVKGDEIFVSGIDKSAVGQTAANIEQTTRITNRDRRIFQDGCFIVKKPGDKDE